MLPETDFPIKGDGLRNWLRTAGQSIYTAFDTGAESLEYLRSIGGAIRTQDFYDIRRQVLELGKYTENLTSYTDNQLTPMAWHNSTHGLELSSNFLYRLKVFGTDPNTGESVEKFFAISSDQQLTPGEAKDILGGMIAGEETFYEVTVDSIELFEALVSPDY